MPQISAGLLMYRCCQGQWQVLLVHPGGPFFQHKDAGAWTIPKGEVESGDDLLATACREFQEETGLTPTAPFVSLNSIKQKGGKLVHAWAFAGDCDPATMRSNTFTLEWPPKSGRQMEFPEVDRAAWFEFEPARTRINPAQVSLIDRLEELLNRTDKSPASPG